MTEDEALNNIGAGVVYWPGHRPPEDGTIVEARGGGLAMVHYRNGEQAGKTCATPVAYLRLLRAGK